MQFESRITWEKLCLELDLLATEAPSSVAPLLLGFNSVLWPSDPCDTGFRRLTYMGFELAARCETMNESDRLAALNAYFFTEQGFQIKDTDDQGPREADFLLKAALQDRRGHALVISLIYLHLAAQLDLPVYMVDLPQRYVLKWVRGGKSNFLDLSDNARMLGEEEIVQLANKTLKGGPNGEDPGRFEVIPAKKIVLLYAEELIQLYEREKKRGQLHICLNVSLKLEPSNLGHLRRRALLCRDLGLHKEALSDIKRYFSFTNRNQAPTDLKMAYFELQNLAESDPGPPEWLH